SSSQASSRKACSTASSSRMPRRQRHFSLAYSTSMPALPLPGGFASRRLQASVLTLDHQFLDLRDGLARVQVFRAILRAVQNRMTTVLPERILERVGPLAGRLVPAGDDPAIRLQQRRRPEVTVRVPPVAR